MMPNTRGSEMTDNREQQPDEIARLIAQAARRSAPSAEMGQSVRIAIEHAWNEAIAQRTARHRALWLSAAAAVGAIALGLLWFGRHHGTASAPSVATHCAPRAPK